MRPARGWVSIKAPAKINLFLHVLDRMPDGYHRIFTWMQAVGLYDRIALRPLRDRGRIRLESKAAGLAAGRENLVWRTAEMFLRQYGISGGIEIRLDKQIPVSAGLGGGSSDAAATLRALYRIFGIPFANSDAIRLGRMLGSDVPFFLSEASALVEETGERIQPIEFPGPAWAVLVNVGVPVSTAWAYSRLDRIGTGRAFLSPANLEKIKLTLAKRQNKINRNSGSAFRLKKLSPYLYNDLEEATVPAHPVIGIVKERLRGLGATGVLMSGSGPTVFGLFHQSRLAVQAARRLRSDHRDWGIWVARLLGRRSSFIRRSSNG